MGASGAKGGGLDHKQAECLRRLAKMGRDLNISQFRFAEVAEIARKFGDAWVQERKRTLDLTQDFIGERLTDDDLLVRGQDGFVIVYAEGDADTAQQHANAVKDDLNEYFRQHGEPGATHEVLVDHHQASALELMQSLAGEASSSKAETAAGGEAFSVETSEDDPIMWRYHPVWDVRRQAISTYYLVPYDRSTGSRVTAYQFEKKRDPSIDLAALDEAALKRSEEVLRKMADSGVRSLLGVNLLAENLSPPALRSRIVNSMADFDPELARNRLVQISAVPVGFPQMYLKEIFESLRRFAPRVAVSLNIDERDLRAAIGLSPSAVGFALAPEDLGENARLSPQDICARVQVAAMAARAAKIPFFVSGALDRSMVVKLRAAGADLIKSELVWQDADAPQDAHMWPAQKLAA